MSDLQMSTVKIELHQTGLGQCFRREIDYELA